MRRGLYRIRAIGGLPDEVRVDDDGIEMPMEERVYSGHNYLPPVAELPWQEDYAKKPPENLPAQQPARTTIRGGLTLGDTASWGSAGRTPGRADSGAAFRSRLGPARK